ncbi:MAG: SRPBCC domain-containing protein [Pyrinomonadaceae bacterium]
MNEMKHEIVITREFDAPRQLLWDAWTQTEHIEKWWGPRGFTTRVTSIDMRVGGKWNYVMIGPDGAEYPVNGIFTEITPPERIVTTDEFGENYDEIMPNVDLPKGLIATAVFDDLGQRSRLTITVSHPTEADRKKHEDMGVVAGWNSSLDKMEEYLAEVQSKV